MSPSPRYTEAAGVDPITGGVLAQIDEAKAFLDSFTGTVEEVTEIRDRASAWVEFFKHCQTGLHAQNLAAELKIRCERKLGELLGETPGPGRPKKMSHDVTFPNIGRMAVNRLRKIASVPEGELIAYFHTCREEGLEITSAGVLREWARLNRELGAGEEVPKEVQPEESDEVRPEFWKSATTCRDEVRRIARKLKDIRTVLSGLVESPYQPLLRKAAHGDKSVAMEWGGEETKRDGALGVVLVEKVYTCSAIESLASLIAGLEVLFDREVEGD